MYNRQVDCDEKMIICHQLDLIKALKLMECEVSRFSDQLVANITKYCDLKAIDDGYFSSLTIQQKNHMHLLKESLGLGEKYEIPDKDAAINKVKQVSKEVLIDLNSALIKLEDAPQDEKKPDIEKMRQLQKDLNITSLEISIKKQFEGIIPTIITNLSSDYELQAVGGLHKISKLVNHVMPLISKITASVASNMIKF